VLSERYRILRKLGEGGMGVVYLAEHVVIEKKLALKVLFPDLTRRADLIQRFMQEAKSASRIGHENVIDITDFGQSPEGYVFIAMEYLSGQDLGQLLKAAGLLSWQRAQPIVVQIVKALRAAHERGIIHRDMKPENIFVTPRDDGREFVKVLDFGIAKVMGLDEDVPRLTRTGMIFGTPEYMSPEQAQGQSVDHRVDIYAVGCIMFHILTGRVPFQADSFMGILSKHMMEAPEPPRSLNPAIDPAIEAVILRAMEKDPAKRFQSMRELLQALVPTPSAELSGAVSASSGLTTVGSAAAAPSSDTGAAPAAQAHSRTPVSRGTTAAAPLPFATHELAGRASIPLAAANPEVRRSRTETFSRADGPSVDAPPQRAPAGKVGLLALGAGVLLAGGVGFVLLHARSAGSPPAAAHSAASTRPIAPASPSPPSAVPAAAPAAPSGADPEATPKIDGAAGDLNADPRGAKTIEGKPAERKAAHRRRSSRQAVDTLRVPEAGDTPAAKPAVRTPAELKNPFVH